MATLLWSSLRRRVVGFRPVAATFQHRETRIFCEPRILKRKLTHQKNRSAIGFDLARVPAFIAQASDWSSRRLLHFVVGNFVVANYVNRHVINYKINRVRGPRNCRRLRSPTSSNTHEDESVCPEGITIVQFLSEHHCFVLVDEDAVFQMPAHGP